VKTQSAYKSDSKNSKKFDISFLVYPKSPPKFQVGHTILGSRGRERIAKVASVLAIERGVPHKKPEI